MTPTLAAHTLEAAADAIMHVCPAGRVRSWNRGATEIFGVEAAQAMGKCLNELVIPDHVRHIRPLDPKPQFDRRHLRRAPALRADGTFFTSEFTVMELLADGAGGGSVVMLRDASAMGETVRKLRTRVAQLESDMERLVALARPPGRREASSSEVHGTAGSASEDAGGARNEAPVHQRVEAMLTSQVQCVLATTAADHAPSTFLMAFAASPCLRSVFVATPLRARKAQQMLERPAVSLLWDNRTGNLADHGAGMLVSASGQAAEVAAEELPSAAERFVAKNPNMAAFLASEGVSVFEIRIGAYELVEGYGRPQQWVPQTRVELQLEIDNQ